MGPVAEVQSDAGAEVSEASEASASSASTVLCIVPGPDLLLASRDDGERWCFGCRARLPHRVEVWGDSEPSYYEPIAVRRCSRCNKDRTEFPRG